MGRKKKEEVVYTAEELEKSRLALRMLVRIRDPFQDTRTVMGNVLGKKSDGSDQDVERRPILAEDDAMLCEVYDATLKQEAGLTKRLAELLKRFPVYTRYLKHTKGIAEVSASWIISEFDINKATTASKMWQYAGLNPGMVRGKKLIKVSEYEPRDGEIVRTLPKKGDKPARHIVLTDTLVRGDKLTPGFISPFNKRLRIALLGVMADCFVRSQNSYCMEYYYPYKTRLENSENTVLEITKRGEKPHEVKWKDAKLAHRDRAAKRYMVKMFLIDLYKAWREIAGLPIRASYQEEKLGHVHAA